MIYRLRRKFILICMLSFLLVALIILFSIFTISAISVNQSLDALADLISENNGRFPHFDDMTSEQRKPPPLAPEFINRESSFTTRFFTVCFDSQGGFVSSNVESVASVGEDTAVSLARQALDSKSERGWIDEYRYKVVDSDDKMEVVFVNGSMQRSMSRTLLMASFIALSAAGTVLLCIFIFLSKYAVKATAESYEKQKRFITDANHELKTPLTLILANVDIIESDLGKNEWLDDIRSEGERMGVLIKRLIYLSRMDEEDTQLSFADFDLGAAVADSVASFRPASEKNRLFLGFTSNGNSHYFGDEAAIRQLLSILLDNAIKYCDDNGWVKIFLDARKHPVLYVDNSCSSIAELKLDRLFDRFYQADTARADSDGFGIGLSIAKSIAEKHGGYIKALSLNNSAVRFKVKLR